MMDKRARQAATAAYKDRRPEQGVFVVRCTATTQQWVGRSNHLDTQRNSLWFTLRQGSFPNRTLQSVWSAEGEAAFEFEVLERLPEDLPQHAIADKLKYSLEKWREALGANAL